MEGHESTRDTNGSRTEYCGRLFRGRAAGPTTVPETAVGLTTELGTRRHRERFADTGGVDAPVELRAGGERPDGALEGGLRRR